MLTKLVCKYGNKIIANPDILLKTAPILIPVLVYAAVHDTVEYLKK